jgi:thioredoxin-related protein
MGLRSGYRNVGLALAVLFFPGGYCCTRAEEPAPIQWLTEYVSARRQGIKEDRLVLLFVTSENCGYCVKMQKETLSDRTIIKELQNKFVPAKLKLKTGDELAQQLQVNIYPTTLIISPQGKILDYARGYLTTSELRQRMDNALIEQHSLASSR